MDDAARRPGATFWVENQPADERSLEKVIAASLAKRGCSVTSGKAAERPAIFDYLVTYEDRWFWDMRMYLRDLRVTVLDAKTNALMGVGRSAQDSLSALGLSFEDVADRAIAALVDGPSKDQTKR